MQSSVKCDFIIIINIITIYRIYEIRKFGLFKRQRKTSSAPSNISYINLTIFCLL